MKKRRKQNLEVLRGSNISENTVPPPPPPPIPSAVMEAPAERINSLYLDLTETIYEEGEIVFEAGVQPPLLQPHPTACEHNEILLGPSVRIQT